MAQMDGWVGFVVARYLGLWRHDTIEGLDGTEGGSLWSPIINFPGLSAPSSILHTSQQCQPAAWKREGIATQGDHREDRVSEGPGRDLENRDGGSGRENLGRGQRLDRVTVGRTWQAIYAAMPSLCPDETGQGPAIRD